MQKCKTQKILAPCPAFQNEINPAEFLLEDGYDEFWKSKPYKKWEARHPLNLDLEMGIDTLHGI